MATPCTEQEICFGLNRASDEQSLAAFLRLFTSDTMLHELVPRLDDKEIVELVDYLTGLMHHHFSKEEYHRLFLGEEHHH